MLAYLFPESKISVSRTGGVKIAGVLAPYHSRIAWFIKELGLKRVVIRYRAKRFYFPRSLDPRTQQRLRNFFSAECPLVRG
ncbi:MAG: hypothetical protein JWR69_4301 [Pedosphaera sp.]|nr:hypothetical protein [Pedosphaera sp.]